MQRMTGYDAAFIFDERPEEPQHTLKVCVWSREASAAYSLDGTRAFVRSRLPQIPPLRWRAVRVPFDLYHPVWVEDRGLDLTHHVRRRALPQPAGRAELCREISDLASIPLDPERPLWEMWMLEGYEGDKVVAVLKMSHALADGAASRRLLEKLYAEVPVGADTSVRSQPAGAEALPSRWTLIVDAARDRLRSAVHELPKLARTTRAARRSLRNHPVTRRYHGRRISVLASPPTPFAGPPSEKRAFHFVNVSLEAAREMRRDLDCSITDIVLATTAGAVRRYLGHHRALPGLPTLAHMPASTRAEDEGDAWGNRITRRPLSLPTHIADPIARLRAASELAREAVEDLQRRRGANLEDWLRWLPPYAAKGVSRLARTLVRMRPELPGGVSVTSVRGPAGTLHAPGGRVEELVSVGHLKYIAGLNVTVWSYDRKLGFGLYACPRAVPDLPRFSDMVAASFEELRKAASREAARVERPGKE